MGIYRSDIASLRKNIEDNKGKKIIIKEAPGKRSKPLEKSATIQSIYKDYFSVKFDETDRVGSYNYTDLFTRSVEVNLCGEDCQIPLVEPQIEIKKQKIQV